jgi:endo-alpha-1,4-polygalactosaminidase (GH114 family)
VDFRFCHNDYVLAENLLTDMDFNKNNYVFVPEAQYQTEVFQLNALKKINSRLLLLSLDYWDPKDVKTIQQIYQTERKNGFIPYVSTQNLSQIYPGS